MGPCLQGGVIREGQRPKELKLYVPVQWLFYPNEKISVPGVMAWSDVQVTSSLGGWGCPGNLQFWGAGDAVLGGWGAVLTLHSASSSAHPAEQLSPAPGSALLP